MQPHLSSLLAAAALIASPVLAVPGIVTLPYAKYEGLILSNGITQWLGMRYAAPPIGNLRFRPPEEPKAESKVQCVQTHGDLCLVTGNPVDDPGHSEDCLFIDVQAPSMATETSKLPVFVYIHGDGYNNSQTDTNINATHFMEHNGNDFLVVTFNYRVGPYGFLTHGDGMATNNGIRDQIKALDWVTKYIRHFGGDPNHVVLGGSGIGAQDVLIHLTMQAPRNPHFKAIIAESPAFPEMHDIQQAKSKFHAFATQLDCAEKHAVSCLTDLPASKIQEATRNNSFSSLEAPPWDTWVPVIDNDLIVNSTTKSFKNKHFARVPFIIGNILDAGTAFSFRNASSTENVMDFMHDLYPNLLPKDLDEIDSMYPNKNGSCPELAACSQGQISGAYQDSRYTCPALTAIESMRAADVEHAYVYLWNVHDAGDAEATDLAARQNIEAGALWGPEYGNVPESYKEGGANELVPHVKQRYWANFIRTFNPNKPHKLKDFHNSIKVAGHKEIHLENWGGWWPGWRRRLEFRNGGQTKTKDTLYLKWVCSFWNRLAPRMHI